MRAWAVPGFGGDVPQPRGNLGALAGKLIQQCLQRLGRMSEFDDFVEKVIKAHDGNWRLLQAAAQEYDRVEHYGYIIAGKYERGGHRGGGRLVNSLERDRIRALQLMDQAL